MDRSEINRALAKALAYKQCGKDARASVWAAKLIHLLECADILKTDYEDVRLVDDAMRLAGITA